MCRNMMIAHCAVWGTCDQFKCTTWSNWNTRKSNWNVNLSNQCELFKSMCDLYQFNLKTLNDVTFNSIISYIIYILYYTLCILYALSMKRFKSIQSINKQSLNGEITERSLFICKSNGIERSWTGSMWYMAHVKWVERKGSFTVQHVHSVDNKW